MDKRRWVRVGVLFAVAVIVGPVAAASTGVAREASRTAAAKTPKHQSLAAQTLALVDETLGGDAAMATIRARDEGYTLAQTLEAVGEGLTVDGSITDDSGVVAPEDPPAGVLDEAGEAKVEEALAVVVGEIKRTKGVDTPRKYRELLDVTVLLQLMTQGYTLDQLVFDGIIAGGVVLNPYGGADIVEEKVDERGKRVTRRVEPGEPEFDDPATASIVNDMVQLVVGHDPLDPDFRPQYRVTLSGTITVEGNLAKLQGSGRIGVAEGNGGCCLGRVRGKLTVPAGECDGEVAPVTISYNGFTETQSGEMALAQGWLITGASKSTGGGSDPDRGICITVAEAPELFELLASIVGPMRGFVEPGETLTDASGNLKLHIDKKI